MAARILTVEMAKGGAIVVLARAFGGDGTALIAGAAAVAGNLFNPWRRFRGGQGLGITAGVTIALWPVAFMPAVLLIGIAARLFRASAPATLLALGVYAVAAVLAQVFRWPNWWGVDPAAGLGWFGPGIAALIAPKQVIRLR